MPMQSSAANRFLSKDGPALATSNATDDTTANADADKPSTAATKDDSTANESAEEHAVTPPEKPVAPPKFKPHLSQSQAALRDQVRQTLANYLKQPFGTRQNTAGDIMDFCLPYGCATEITLQEASGERRANGITCLCWNFPCADSEPLSINNGHIAARLGYGAQSQPSQFLATLAFARVQANYPLRANNATRTVADLIESEKLSCRAGSDMSLKLIGLAYYAESADWKNDLGEDWSVEKIVREELNRSAPSAGDAVMNRLLGLAYVNYRLEKRNVPLEGQFARADKYIKEFHKYAFAMQNPDGSWGNFLAARSTNKDPAAELRSTAYVLEWLAISLPEEQLADHRVAAAVNDVVRGLNTQRNLSGMANLPSREINSISHALHALSLYEDRYYKNAVEDKPAVEKTAAQPNAASAAPQRYPTTQNSR
jgi:hypothetical protein